MQENHLFLPNLVFFILKHFVKTLSIYFNKWQTLQSNLTLWSIIYVINNQTIAKIAIRYFCLDKTIIVDLTNPLVVSKSCVSHGVVPVWQIPLLCVSVWNCWDMYYLPLSKKKSLARVLTSLSLHCAINEVYKLLHLGNILLKPSNISSCSSMDLMKYFALLSDYLV